MPLLQCKEYVPPLLSVLLKHPEGIAGSDLAETVATLTNLSDDERKDTISDGTPKYVVRIKQARYWLKLEGYVAALSNGSWALTSKGKKFVEESGGAPSKLSRAPRKQEFGAQRGEDKEQRRSRRRDEELDEAPLEQIDHALERIGEAVAVDILQRLSAASSGFFERVVLMLLHAMGYAGKLGKAEHTGGPGDGGIDGILYLDRLGLERVYVQAKKWTKPVGSPELQGFCGALSMHHASKGVIISTAPFTEQAIESARRAPQAIRTIGGEELARLMIEFGVGVSRTKVRVVPEVDQGFFVDA
jgi:restriction system protein